MARNRRKWRVEATAALPSIAVISQTSHIVGEGPGRSSTHCNMIDRLFISQELGCDKASQKTT